MIDDEEDIRRIAQIALHSLGGLDVLLAADAAQGLYLAETGRPDVILLDLMMPGVDGTAALRMLRGNATTAHIPVLFLTAKAHAADDPAVRALGAQGLLAKPFDPITLADSIRALLRLPEGRPSREK